MKTTKTVMMLLAAGSLAFAACQSNNKPTALRADTASGAVYNDNMANNLNQPNVTPATTDNGSTAAATQDNTPVATENHSVLIDTTEMVCVPRRRRAPKVVATAHVRSYNKWRYAHHNRTRKSTVVEETAVTSTDVPVTQEPVADVPVTTPIVTPEPAITYKQENEFTGNIVAPPAKRAKVHLAPEVGGNLNNMYMHTDGFETSNELKAGVNGGVMVNIELGKRLGLEPGVRYIMKGGILTSTSTNGLVTTQHKEKITFHYVEMPLNLVYYTGDWGTNRWMIGAGPYASLLVNAQDKTKDKIKSPDGTIEQNGQHSMAIGNTDNNPGNLRQVDAGAGGFIGYQTRSGVYVKGGAEIGVLGTQKRANPSGFYDKNYNFLLQLGYMCGYKKK